MKSIHALRTRFFAGTVLMVAESTLLSLAVFVRETHSTFPGMVKDLIAKVTTPRWIQFMLRFTF